MSFQSFRDVTMIVDDGYFTDDRAIGKDGFNRITTGILRLDTREPLLSALLKMHQDKYEEESTREFSPFATVSVLKQGSSLEDYLENRSEHAQVVDFIYGEFGELYMLPLPHELPIRMTLRQLELVVERHFKEYSSATIVVRRQGGFGAVGVALSEQVAQWLLEDAASHFLGGILIWALTKVRKLTPQRILDKRHRRYAQIARDMGSRYVTSLYYLDAWLGTRATWSTRELMIALALPRHLAARMLKQAGYSRVAFSTTWVRGEDSRSTEQRNLWAKRIELGHNWSPFEEGED